MPEDDGVGYGSQRQVSGACQIVGNLLWALPPEAATPMVEKDAIHIALWKMLVNREIGDDEDVTYSVVGLLIQLTRPSAHVRALIGDDENAEMALKGLCEHKTPQVKQQGINLLRALGKECPVNQERFGSLAAQITIAPAETGRITDGA